MNTRPEERLPYLELARQGARVVRTLQAESLERLGGIAPAESPLRAELCFHMDERGRPWVTGSARVVLKATCQGCLEAFDHRMEVDFSLCIVRDPELATALADEADVLVAEADTVSVADVVEDELILSLPERLCLAAPCPYAPALTYPADEPESARPRPFEALSILKRR